MPSDNYQPKPINTDGISLSHELNGLVECLAENAHELWAQQRIKDGWIWGPKRDDGAKKHPCLVTYAQLPESEKEYDRVVVRGVLKSILALGYARTKRRARIGQSWSPKRRVETRFIPNLWAHREHITC